MSAPLQKKTAIILALILIPLFGCPLASSLPGMKKRVDAQTVSGSTAGSTGVAFTALHTFAKTKCSTCHGVNQTPLFAVTTASSAYDSFVNDGIINYTTAASSFLLTNKVVDNHCSSFSVTACSGSDLTQWTNLVSDFVDEKNTN